MLACPPLEYIIILVNVASPKDLAPTLAWYVPKVGAWLDALPNTLPVVTKAPPEELINP